MPTLNPCLCSRTALAVPTAAQVLGVDDDASTSEVKRAYRALAKECHPDYLGDTGHNICILLNEVR